MKDERSGISSSFILRVASGLLRLRVSCEKEALRALASLPDVRGGSGSRYECRREYPQKLCGAAQSSRNSCLEATPIDWLWSSHKSDHGEPPFEAEAAYRCRRYGG